MFSKPARLFFLLLLPLQGCILIQERATKVDFEGGNPPIFVLSGSGRLEELVIIGPKQREIDSYKKLALWSIQPEHTSGARFLEDIQKIQYGVVPKGYVQEYPENAVPAPALVPGIKYRYMFITSDAPHSHHYFEIRDGKAVELPEETSRQ